MILGQTYCSYIFGSRAPKTGLLPIHLFIPIVFLTTLIFSLSMSIWISSDALKWESTQIYPEHQIQSNLAGQNQTSENLRVWGQLTVVEE